MATWKRLETLKRAFWFALIPGGPFALLGAMPRLRQFEGTEQGANTLDAPPEPSRIPSVGTLIGRRPFP